MSHSWMLNDVALSRDSLLALAYAGFPCILLLGEHYRNSQKLNTKKTPNLFSFAPGYTLLTTSHRMQPVKTYFVPEPRC